MAAVYRARDRKHGRDVAVKILHAELSATLASERFLREIEIAAQLNHPNILPVHDSGEADGLLYYVMPLVDDESVEARLQRDRRLTVDESLRIAREVAGGLAYAHARGLVHRDIKPANVLLQAGHALVADFGIARAVQAHGERLTGVGLSIGTPLYMSPEQALGSPDVDHRADIYSVGAMLYEMLTGDPPFVGSSEQAVIAKVVTAEATPMSELVPGIPAVMERVVAKAMAKEADDRYRNAEAFADALTLVEMNLLTEGVRDVVQTKGDQVPNSGRATTEPPSKTRTAVVAGVSTAAALAVVYALMQQAGLAPWVFAVLVAPIAVGLPLANWILVRHKRE
jgi:serine/threonine-protein kinase